MNVGGREITIPVWTREDYQGIKPFKWLYGFRDNKFVMLQLRDAVRQRAGEAGVKNFIQKWKLYLESMESEKPVIYDNVTEFEGQPVELYCNEYQCDEYGVITYDRFGGEIIVCRHPILPVRRLLNVDTGETKLEIAYKRGGRWKSAVFPKDVLASAQKILELARYDVAVDSGNARALVKYITCLESENYGRLGETKSVGRLGWIKGHGFSPYMEGLRFDGDISFKHMYESVRSRGSYEKWLEVMRDIRRKGTIARIQIAASFASVLVEPLGCLPFFVHVWGGTEAGKTVGLMAAASVWADPDLGSYIHTFNATAVGQENAAGFVNSLPLCIDELQVIKDRRDFDSIVYMLTEGIGRSRGAKSGGLQRIQTWRNCVLSTGEMPITRPGSGGGAVNRIVEIDCEDEKLFSQPRLVADTVKRNYGHGGEAFIRCLSDNMEEAEREYARFYDLLSGGDSTEKQAMAGALILTADALSEKWVFRDGIRLAAEELAGFLTTKETVDQNRRAADWVLEFVASNPAKFGQADGLCNEIWGEIDSGFIYIIKSVFDRHMSEAGFNPQAFLSWAKRRGLLDTAPNRTVKRKRIRGVDVIPWCVCLRRAAVTESESIDH